MIPAKSRWGLLKNMVKKSDITEMIKNIADANFEKVLSYGKGLFLKLNNDTLKHQDGSLDNLLQTITENKETRNILFFQMAHSTLIIPLFVMI